MSTWTAPVTFTASTLPAALMNSEVRDHATFLKGFADLITNSTTADTGDGTYLWVKRPATSSTALNASVTGDTIPRWRVYANGDMEWGSGTTMDISFKRTTYSSKTTLALGDTNAAIGGWITATGYSDVTADARAAFAVRETGDTGYRMMLTTTVDGATATPGLLAGSGTANDTNFFRSAADTWKSSDGIWAVGGLVTMTKAGIPVDGDLATGMQQSGAIVIDTTNSRIYVRVGATWKFVAVA